MYRQYKITSGTVERICWLDRDQLIVGQKVTLKDDRTWQPDRVWTIAEVYKEVLKDQPWRTWKVGGLQ